MSINIAIFTIVLIFVLLLFYTLFSKKSTIKPEPSLMYSSLGTPLFGAIDDDEKLTDDNEKKFRDDYDNKNKNIVKLQKELDLCIKNRTNLNNAIQKFRDELITTVTNTSNLKQNEVTNCDKTRDSRIQKYMNTYNQRFNTNITKQEVINKIANGTLSFK